MATLHPALVRAQAFCDRFNLRVPILLAPMAGGSAPALSIAVANAGGLGACGTLLMAPADIAKWAATVRAGSNGGFNLNIWIPDPPPRRDAARAAAPPDSAAGGGGWPGPAPGVRSGVGGLYPPAFVAQLKARRITWFANISTVAEARAAEAAGADVVVAQGMEAGGHRGCFDEAAPERELVGLFALVPAVVDAVRIPVVATGGIADPRAVAAPLLLGPPAGQI